jgi:hypothetical protein
LEDGPRRPFQEGREHERYPANGCTLAAATSLILATSALSRTRRNSYLPAQHDKLLYRLEIDDVLRTCLRLRMVAFGYHNYNNRVNSFDHACMHNTSFDIVFTQFQTELHEMSHVAMLEWHSFGLLRLGYYARSAGPHTSTAFSRLSVVLTPTSSACSRKPVLGTQRPLLSTRDHQIAGSLADFQVCINVDEYGSHDRRR